MVHFFKVTLLFLFIVSFNSTYCQQSNSIVVIGKIIDKSDNTSIPLVNVYTIKNKQGTATNKDGFFVLNLSRKKNTFRLSHINYYSDSLEITKSQIKNKDTLFLNIALQPKQTELRTVSISSGKSIELAYQKRGVIIDYEFIDDDVLLLLKAGSSLKLSLVDAQDNVITEKLVDLKKVKLVKDCFNNVHIVSDYIALQIVIEDNDLSFIKNSIKNYDNYLKPCMVDSDKKLFFYQNPSRHNKQTIYFSIDKSTQEKGLLLRVHDQLADQYARDSYYENISYYHAHVPPKDNIILAGVWDGDIEKLLIPSDFESLSKVSFYLHIASTPIYSPLKQINQSIFVFDHVNDSLLIYNLSGQLKQSLFINYHHAKNWKKEIIVNEDGTDAYAKFNKDGITSLKKINLITGKTTNMYRLESHIFPKKIKVKDNYIYYLHMDKNGLNTGMYKQLLD